MSFQFRHNVIYNRKDLGIELFHTHSLTISPRHLGRSSRYYSNRIIVEKTEAYQTTHSQVIREDSVYQHLLDPVTSESLFRSLIANIMIHCLQLISPWIQMGIEFLKHVFINLPVGYLSLHWHGVGH